MRLSQKRNCNDCKSGVFNWQCQLGKEVKPGRKIMGVIVEWIPQEPCLKPMTVREAHEAERDYHAQFVIKEQKP